jgi:hypothetical protein
MPAMISYSHRLQSGHITCQFDRTFDVLTTNRTLTVAQPKNLCHTVRAMAEHSLVILRYQGTVPVMASCSKCHHKFFTPSTFQYDAVEVKGYLVSKFDWHQCNETSTASLMAVGRPNPRRNSFLALFRCPLNAAEDARDDKEDDKERSYAFDSYEPKGECGSDFLKMSHASRPKHTSRPPIAAESASACADHMLVTNRLPNTDAR